MQSRSLLLFGWLFWNWWFWFGHGGLCGRALIHKDSSLHKHRKWCDLLLSFGQVRWGNKSIEVPLAHEQNLARASNNFCVFWLDPKLIEAPFIVYALNGGGHLFFFVWMAISLRWTLWDLANNCLPTERQFKWGQINFNLVNQRGQRQKGADDFWYPSMRKPPFAFVPFDWKLMLIWPHLNFNASLECWASTHKACFYVQRFY